MRAGVAGKWTGASLATICASGRAGLLSEAGPHFFATHLMQALPLLGLLLDRYLPGHVRNGLLVGTAAGILIVAGTFIQAATGHPFL